MNNKGQYYPKPSYNSIHPVLILGIVVFIIPYSLNIIGIKSIPEWIDTGLNFLGILIILIGAGLSIFKASN